MTYLRRLGFTTAVAVATVVAIVGTAAGAGTWKTLAPVPAATEGMQVAVVDGQIIAAYGYSFGDTNLTRIYDIETDSWSSGAAAPGPVRSEGAAVDHGGFFYAVGGRPTIVDLERYDPATNTWLSLANMPTGRAGLGAAVVGNAIYAIGGRIGSTPCSGGELATVERYDIDTDTWSTVAPLPSARSDLAAVAHGGKIYVFGGCAPLGFRNDVDVYDPVTDTWSTAPLNMPTARASMYGAAAKGGTIYVIGGWNGSGQLTTNEAYDVAADAWSTELAMPSPRAEMGVVFHGGRIYTVGGGLTGNSSNLNLSFKPTP